MPRKKAQEPAPPREPHTGVNDTYWTVETATKMIERPPRTLYSWLYSGELAGAERHPDNEHIWLLPSEEVLRLDRLKRKRGFHVTTVLLRRKSDKSIIRLQGIKRRVTPVTE